MYLHVFTCIYCIHDAKVDIKDIKGIYACTVGYGVDFEWTFRLSFHSLISQVTSPSVK